VIVEIAVGFLVAIFGGAIGSLITINILKVKVEALEEWKEKMEAKVVFKDTCTECKGNWVGQVGELRKDMKDGLEKLDGKIDKVLQRLTK